MGIEQTMEERVAAFLKELEEFRAAEEAAKLVPKPLDGDLQNRQGTSPSGGRLLTDAEWRSLKGYLPRRRIPHFRRQRSGGRPRVPDRWCFEASIWLLVNDAPLRALPPEFGARSTVQRRLTDWSRGPILIRLWRDYFEIRGDTMIRPPTITARKTLWRLEVEGLAHAVGRISVDCARI